MASKKRHTSTVDLYELYGDDIPEPEPQPEWPRLNEHVQRLAADPRWKRLKASDRRLMKALVEACDPLTGDLQVSAVTLLEELYVTEETLRLSRLRLIEAGLIVSYRPGTGHTVSTYRLALSWDEVDGAAATP